MKLETPARRKLPARVPRRPRYFQSSRKIQTMFAGISTSPEIIVLTKMSPESVPVFKDNE